MKAIILAGGFATRLWPLTEKRAKPLLLLNNKEVISHIIEKIPKEIEIIISTNAVFKEDFEIYLENNNFGDRKIIIFIEDSFGDEGKKGALGATSLLIEKKNISEDVLLIAGDNYFGFDFKNFEKNFGKNLVIASYDFGEKEKAKGFGVIVTEDGKTVKKFEEKPINPSSSLISTGFYFFPKKFLKDIKFYSKENPDNLGGIFEYFLSKNEKINIFTFKDLWFDIGSFRDLIEAHKILQEENYFGDKEKKIEKNILENKNILNKKNFFGKNVKIFNSKIENCIIYENCEIKDCELRDCIIDKNCKLKDLELYGKIIRENSEI